MLSNKKRLEAVWLRRNCNCYAITKLLLYTIISQSWAADSFWKQIIQYVWVVAEVDHSDKQDQFVKGLSF